MSIYDIFFLGAMVGVVSAVFAEWRWDLITRLLDDLLGEDHDPIG